jgi:hypothetical protein
MNGNELHKQMGELAQHLLALATSVNRLNTPNGEAQQIEEALSRETQGNAIRLLEDLVRQRPRYKNYATGRDYRIVGLLSSPIAQDALRVATAEGRPAVAGIAESLVQDAVRGGWELTKQIGSSRAPWSAS